jgi:hypothetical protein
VKLWRSVVAHKPSRQLLVLKTGSRYSIGPGERQPFPVSQSSWSGSKQRPSPREGSALSGRPTVWPTSVRNRWPGSIGTGGRLQIGISGRLQVGIGGRLTSESAGIPGYLPKLATTSRTQKPTLRPWWRSDRRWMQMSIGAVLIAKTREPSTAGIPTLNTRRAVRTGYSPKSDEKCRFAVSACVIFCTSTVVWHAQRQHTERFCGW